jgi:hypothetical protein
MLKTHKCIRCITDNINDNEDDIAVSKTIVVVFLLNENVTKDDVRTLSSSLLLSIVDTRQSFFHSPTRQ